MGCLRKNCWRGWPRPLRRDTCPGRHQVLWVALVSGGTPYLRNWHTDRVGGHAGPGDQALLVSDRHHSDRRNPFRCARCVGWTEVANPPLWGSGDGSLGAGGSPQDRTSAWLLISGAVWLGDDALSSRFCAQERNLPLGSRIPPDPMRQSLRNNFTLDTQRAIAHSVAYQRTKQA